MDGPHCETCSCSVPACDVANDHAEQLTALDEKILRTKEQLRTLQLRRNQLLPVVRLAPELLVEIFQFLKPSNILEVSPTSWIRFSQVCAYWRRVALDCPVLWTAIPLRYMKGAPELLRRAASAPLSFSNYTVTGLQPQLALIRKHSSHVARLHLDDFREVLKSTGLYSSLGALLDRLDMPMPILKALSITHHGVSVPLPARLFSGSTPSLECLSLTGCTLVPHIPFIESCNLKELHLVNPKIISTPGHTDIVPLLAGLRHLQICRLDGDIPTGPLDPARTIRWPHLRELTLACSYTQAASLLRHLHMSPSAQLSITCRKYTAGHCQQLFAALRAQYPGFDNTPFVVEVDALEGILARTAGSTSGGVRSLRIQGVFTCTAITDVVSALSFADIRLDLSHITPSNAELQALVAALGPKTRRLHLYDGKGNGSTDRVLKFLAASTRLSLMEELIVNSASTSAGGPLDKYLLAIVRVHVPPSGALRNVRLVNCRPPKKRRMDADRLATVESLVTVSWET